MSNELEPREELFLFFVCFFFGGGVERLRPGLISANSTEKNDAFRSANGGQKRNGSSEVN